MRKMLKPPSNLTALMRRQSICQKRRLTVDQQLSRKGRARVWKTLSCARKVEGSVISPVNSMIPASTRQRRGCGVALRAKNVPAISSGRKRSPTDLLSFPSLEAASYDKKQPANAGCFLSRACLGWGGGIYAPVSSASLAVSAFSRVVVPDVSAGIVALGRAFLGALPASVTNSIRHMGEPSPRRKPTLTRRV